MKCKWWNVEVEMLMVKYKCSNGNVEMEILKCKCWNVEIVPVCWAKVRRVETWNVEIEMLKLKCWNWNVENEMLKLKCWNVTL